jgi:hypothetical protein
MEIRFIWGKRCNVEAPVHFNRLYATRIIVKLLIVGGDAFFSPKTIPEQ